MGNFRSVGVCNAMSVHAIHDNSSVRAAKSMYRDEGYANWVGSKQMIHPSSLSQWPIHPTPCVSCLGAVQQATIMIDVVHVKQ